MHKPFFLDLADMYNYIKMVLAHRKRKANKTKNPKLYLADHKLHEMLMDVPWCRGCEWVDVSF